jgi:hypothetical protein
VIWLLIKLFGPHWKSTVAGYLAAMMGFCGPLTAYFAGLAHPHDWQVAVPGIITLVSGVGRAWVGILMKDAGVTEAILAGETIPKMVPSHEEPDAEGAKVVIEK